jgi:hypothetical protein
VLEAYVSAIPPKGTSPTPKSSTTPRRAQSPGVNPTILPYRICFGFLHRGLPELLSLAGGGRGEM